MTLRDQDAADRGIWTIVFIWHLLSGSRRGGGKVVEGFEAGAIVSCEGICVKRLARVPPQELELAAATHQKPRSTFADIGKTDNDAAEYGENLVSLVCSFEVVGVFTAQSNSQLP